MTLSRILIVDDEASLRTTLSRALTRKSYQVINAENRKKAYSLSQSDIKIDLALIDLQLPDGNGLELLVDIKAIHPDIKVIILTGYGTVETAVEAKKRGATHFITKPFNIEEVLSTIDNTLSQKKLETENYHLKMALDSRYKYHNIIGQSPETQSVINLIKKVSPSESTVLITGESGTGKELVAKAIHFNSTRSKAPFIPINCGAIPSELLESELFGHIKGAFTNAISNRIGRFESAEGGTIFFDEIGDMSPHLQVKLLRVIQDGNFMPVGSNKTRSSNVRVIAATNVKLEEAIVSGRFREDLYYRLNVIPIHIPSLKERAADIPILFYHFMEKFNKTNKQKIEGITSEAMQLLCEYSWPGNIRELENLVERVSILKKSGIVEVDDLPKGYYESEEFNQKQNSEPFINIPEEGIDFYAAIKDYEEKILLQALKQTNWNKNQAAILLKLNRTTLIEKLKKKGIKQPHEKEFYNVHENLLL